MLTSSLRTPSPHRADMGTAYVTVAPFRGVDVMCGCVPNSGPSPPHGSVLCPLTQRGVDFVFNLSKASTLSIGTGS